MTSDTSITEGSTAQASLPTQHSLAAFTHMGPQGLGFGKSAVSRLKGVNMPFHI